MDWFSILEGETIELRGAIGEQDVNDVLIHFSRKNNIHFGIVGNIRLQNEKGKGIQIDTIYINPNGIFVIETKKWDGLVTGKVEDAYWERIVTKRGVRKTYQYKNPIKQNDYHVSAIRSLLSNNIPVHSLVVFASNNASHLNIDNVISITKIPQYFMKMESDAPLSNEVIDDLFSSVNVEPTA